MMSLLNFMAVISIVICAEVYIGLHIMEQLHLDCEKKIQHLKNELQDLSEKVEELVNKYKEILIEECASSPCMNGATCIDGIMNYSCICMAGYNGKNCQTDVDECLSSPCKNQATCNDHLNGFTCSCADGWMGKTCETDLDECVSSPCQNRGTCNDHVNGFTCTCVDGWMGNKCEKALYYGTSFITGFLKNHYGKLAIPTLLIACPEETANIYVSIPALNIVNTHHEMKGGMLTLKYSNNITSHISGLISNKGVHIIADRPVMLFAGSIKNASADGSLVPPEISLGTDYIISGYPSYYDVTDEFLIVGTEDRTLITMNIKSVMVNITLNRMETYMRAEHNLSGSMIFSSAPVYVLSGHSCAIIPNIEVKSCDYIDETMPPISLLGKLYVVSFMMPRPDFTIRTFTGYKTISVVATQPVLVTQYGHGSEKEIGYFGDPSMMTIPDVTHFGHLYYFVVPSEFNSTLVIVMRSLYSISDLLLDDVVFKATKTTTAKINGYEDYLILYGDIDPGYHKLAHSAGNIVSFGAWIYGRQRDTEYAWSLGHT